MTSPGAEMPADVPEADWAEQGIDANPPADLTPGSSPDGRGLGTVEANEADLAEQNALAYSGREDDEQ